LNGIQKNELAAYSLDRNQAIVSAFVLAMIQSLSEPGFTAIDAQQLPASAAVKRRVIYRDRPAATLTLRYRYLHWPGTFVIRLVAGAFPGAAQPGFAFALRGRSRYQQQEQGENG
jgi:hypothetical protein